jgi:Ni,Fe-hydrogenase III small subunit
MFYWRWLKDLSQGPKTTHFPFHPDSRVVSTGETRVMHAPQTGGGPIRRAMAVRHVDGGSCNGCESEMQLLSSPDYDFSRFGFSYTPSPRHADILVVTGVITENMADIIRRVWEGMPGPKRIVALGECAISGHVFRDSPGVLGSLEGIVPVTVEITGCPPTPGDILKGLLMAVDVHSESEEKTHERQAMG